MAGKTVSVSAAHTTSAHRTQLWPRAAVSFHVHTPKSWWTQVAPAQRPHSPHAVTRSPSQQERARSGSAASTSWGTRGNRCHPAAGLQRVGAAPATLPAPGLRLRAPPEHSEPLLAGLQESATSVRRGCWVSHCRGLSVQEGLGAHSPSPGDVAHRPPAGPPSGLGSSPRALHASQSAHAARLHFREMFLNFPLTTSQRLSVCFPFYIQQVFIKHLLCTRHDSNAGNKAIATADRTLRAQCWPSEGRPGLGREGGRVREGPAGPGLPQRVRVRGAVRPSVGSSPALEPLQLPSGGRPPPHGSLWPPPALPRLGATPPGPPRAPGPGRLACVRRSPSAPHRLPQLCVQAPILTELSRGLSLPDCPVCPRWGPPGTLPQSSRGHCTSCTQSGPGSSTRHADPRAQGTLGHTARRGTAGLGASALASPSRCWQNRLHCGDQTC